MLKRFLIGLAIFVIIGIPVSFQVLSIFGLESNYFAIAGIALVLALLLMFRGILLLFLVVLLTFAINLPEDVLVNYGVDKVVLIGFMVIMVAFPTIHKMMSE